MINDNIIHWQPVNPNQHIILPEPWGQLLDSDFSPILHERVRRFALSERENGTLDKYEEFLNVLGEGYLPSAFDQSLFRDNGLELLPFQEKMLEAIQSLSEEFGQNIPSLLWNTLASLVIRPNPTEDASILDVQEHLVHPWYVCDANLHAMGVAYALFFHVQGKLSEMTNLVIFHGCGCTHHLGGAGEVMLRFRLAEQKRAVVGKEFLDHLLSQTALIVEKGYPFRLNDVDVDSTRVVALRPVLTAAA